MTIERRQPTTGAGWLAGVLTLVGVALAAVGSTLLLQGQMAAIATATGEPSPALVRFVANDVVTPLAHSLGQSAPAPARIALGVRIIAWLAIAIGSWLAYGSIRALLRRERAVESS